MFSAIRSSTTTALLILTLFLPLIVMDMDADGYSNQYLFDEATDIYFDTDARDDSLDPENSRDIFRINDLEGDDNQGDLSHRLTISVKKNSGANIKATFFEPNGRPLASLYSEGSWNDVEFFVPYDGDYFLEIRTDPEYRTSTYTIQLGGVKDIVNPDNDGTNKPGSGVSGTIELGRNLHPLNDIVDYVQYDIQPFMAVRANLTTFNDARFEVLNDTEGLIGSFDNGEFFEYRNDGGEEVRVHFRIYYPVTGGQEYSDKGKSYVLNITEWSHTTIPVVNTEDPWPGTIMINEDESLEPLLNLSRHFMEPGDDPIFFEVTSTNTNIDVQLINITRDMEFKNIIYTYANITPKPNWFGEEVVSFRASDQDGSVSGSVGISVLEVNDLPYITRIGKADYSGDVFNMYADEDTTKVYTMEYGDDDDPLNTLTFSTDIPLNTMEFFEILPNGTIILTPSQDDVGKYSVNVTLSDSRSGIHVLELSISIEPVNDRPEKGSIEIRKGNSTLMPSEEIVLEALGFTDIDGDQLVYDWDWGDGKSSTGRISSHVYSTSHSGATTIILTVGDGKLFVKSNLTIQVEAPEDIAIGDLLETVDGTASDSVKMQEEWKLKGSDVKVFTVSTVTQSGLDIMSIRTQRRGSSIQVLLDIKDTIQIDGSFHYHLYMVKSNYSEPLVDFKNITTWDDIPMRFPDQEFVIASRMYVGDPSIYENSTGNIMNKATLVWDIPFSELVEGGLSYPIDPDDYDLFAVSILTQEYAESKGLVERYIITDTAGTGALMVEKIEPLGNSSGSSSSTFGDFSEGSNILVIVGIIAVLLIFGVAGFVLVRRQQKEKKQQEKEFLEHIENLKKEGKDPFGKDMQDEGGSPDVSYKDLYGSEEPEGYEKSSGQDRITSLPGPGLGGPVQTQSNIEELSVENTKGSED